MIPKAGDCPHETVGLQEEGALGAERLWMEWTVRLGGNQPTLYKEFRLLSRVNSHNEYPPPPIQLNS